MSNIIDFLQRLGQDSSLRHAARVPALRDRCGLGCLFAAYFFSN
jgi:hypothetical protein